MLKVSVSTLVNDKEEVFYLFNVIDEDVTYSIPLNVQELMVLDSCLEACLYQNIENIMLEVCRVSINHKRSMVTLQFINYAPMMTFNLQKAEAIEGLMQVKKLLKDM